MPRYSQNFRPSLCCLCCLRADVSQNYSSHGSQSGPLLITGELQWPITHHRGATVAHYSSHGSHSGPLLITRELQWPITHHTGVTMAHYSSHGSYNGPLLITGELQPLRAPSIAIMSSSPQVSSGESHTLSGPLNQTTRQNSSSSTLRVSFDSQSI
jgi:hypothetical protein